MLGMNTNTRPTTKRAPDVTLKGFYRNWLMDLMAGDKDTSSSQMYQKAEHVREIQNFVHFNYS